MYVFGNATQTSFYNLDFLWDDLIPQNSVYRLFRELAPLLIQPEDLKDLYCLDNGRPSNPALQMTLACMLQQMNDLSDRDMEIQTQVNLEFKYALAMSMEQPGIYFVNFHNHRERLIALDLDKVLVDRFTRLLYYLGVLKGDEEWIIDTTHVIAPISAPTSIELVRQGIRMILKQLVSKHPEEWQKLVTVLEASRYLKQVDEPKEHLLDEKQQLSRLRQVVNEAEQLLTILQCPKWRKDEILMDRAAVLQRILNERTITSADGTVKLRAEKVKDILVSAIDPEARFGCKRTTKWRGYKVATVQVGNTGFIAAADVIKANEYDGEAMKKMADQLPIDAVDEAVLLGDTHFGAVNDRVHMEEEAAVKVIAPPNVKTTAGKIHQEGFRINEDHSILTCQGEKPFTNGVGTLTGKNFTLKRKNCEGCPHIDDCFGGAKKRVISINDHHEKLVEIDAYAQTDTYKEQMKLRGRIEAKQDELANHYGMRRGNYFGERKIAYQARMKVLSMNFSRLNRLSNTRENPLKLNYPQNMPPEILKRAS
jgi:transposase